MKRILIVSAFTNPYLENNNRVISIAHLFKTKGWKVEILTANFNHPFKKYYTELHIQNEILFHTHFLSIPGYSKNLSIKRIISHLIFALRAYRYLKKNNNYDLIYLTVPTNIAPYLIIRLVKKKSIFTVVDIIDIWPESFYVLTSKFRGLIKLLTYPWLKISHSVYRNASMLIAASKRYASFGQRFRTDKVYPFLLGVDKEKTESLISTSTIELPLKKDNEIWIAYGGSLGNSYDFDAILLAIENLHRENYSYRFFFIGGGVLEEQISNRIKKNKLNAFVTGRLNYPDYLKWLCQCDIAINSYKKGSLVGYSYKFNDYLATGCCVVNNLPGEIEDLIIRYDLGLNFDFNKKNLFITLKLLLDEPSKIEYFRKNVIKAIDQELSKKIIFEKLYRDIERRRNFE